MRFPHYLLLLLVLLGLSQCKKKTIRPQEPTLPAETQSGQYTLGFKANGTVYVASGVTQTTGSWNNTDDFHFAADTRDGKYELTAIGIILKGTLADGEQFKLVTSDQISNGQNYALPRISLAGGCYYSENTGARLLSGQVTLTRFDGGARMAAGRFQMILVKAGCDTLRVTEGRFDVKF
ncbi:hypothetical protein [Hymenobacter psychrotolerans]|uniref:Uncharacterized protein n=1 Tax=Hymenobacter psychrotolerans DSM 18569 TaxID=1121959 RepID=A0A1M6P531_9BACT|nr:hypothetical protein [Hymenobacter psychrotolerans]SHK03038.1 hypothetical protein SAMN02746009_00124 [Hymenobacter psychrotolerans DSM 18569]